MPVIYKAAAARQPENEIPGGSPDATKAGPDLSLLPYNTEAEHYYELGRSALALRVVFDSPQMYTVQAMGLMAIYHCFAGKKFHRDSAPSDVDTYTHEFTLQAAYIIRRHPGLEIPAELGFWFYQGVPSKYCSLNRGCLLRFLLSHVEDVPFPTICETIKILKDEIIYDNEHPDAEYPLFPIHPKIIDLIDSYCYRNVPDTHVLACIYSASLSARSSPDPTQCQPSFDLKPHSSDNTTWPLSDDASKSKSTNIYDIEHEVPHAEFPSSDPVELLKSSHRSQELSHFDIHGPNHVVPIALQSLTNSTTEPAIAALAPNAIIVDVKHDFCPPTITAAPPLEEPPPRSTSGLLPISADLANSSIVLKAPLGLKHRDGTIKTATDDSGFDSRPHLLSTLNLCPSAPRIEAPLAYFADGTTLQAPEELQDINSDSISSSVSLIAFDQSKIHKIIDKPMKEGTEKVQGMMETGLGDEPMHPTIDIEREAPHVKFPSSVSFKLFTSAHRTHERSHMDILGSFDLVAPTAIQLSTIEPANTALTPTGIIDDVKHDFCPPTTTTRPPLKQPSPRPPSDALLASTDLEDPNSTLNVVSDLQHRLSAIKNSTDDPDFDSRPSLTHIDACHTCRADDRIPQAPQTLQYIDFDLIASDRPKVLKMDIDTTTENAEKVQDRIGTGLDDARTHPATAKYHFVDANGADSLHKADDTISHTQTLLDMVNTSLYGELHSQEVPDSAPQASLPSPSLEFNIDSSSVLPIGSNWQTVLEIGLETKVRGVEEAEDTIKIGIDNVLIHPTAAEYRFVDADGVDSLLKANDTFSHIPSLLDTCKSSLHDELWPQEVPATVLPPFPLEKALINISNSLDYDKSTYRKSLSSYESPVRSNGTFTTLPLKPSTTDPLSQQDVDIDPPPPYSFDDLPGTLTDLDKGTQSFYGAEPLPPHPRFISILWSLPLFRAPYRHNSVTSIKSTGSAGMRPSIVEEPIPERSDSEAGYKSQRGWYAEPEEHWTSTAPKPREKEKRRERRKSSASEKARPAKEGQLSLLTRIQGPIERRINLIRCMVFLRGHIPPPTNMWHLQAYRLLLGNIDLHTERNMWKVTIETGITAETIKSPSILAEVHTIMRSGTQIERSDSEAEYESRNGRLPMIVVDITIVLFTSPIFGILPTLLYG
ncbi:hypothetical protein DXG01_010892 [Tephrocybe rancida]|nr:hypothetical protein DXG01_010892 [Tephrocybe rancida]